MDNVTYFEILEESKPCYDLPGFQPIQIDAQMLGKRGVDYPIIDRVNNELIAGSKCYKRLFETQTLIPAKKYIEALTDVNEELAIHNYTGICPTNVLEVSPSSGSCAVACQYCLVTDGRHNQDIQVYLNYPEKLANSLKRNKDKAIFYYISPKTEVFSEPHLFNGLAHNIIRTFISHFEEYPDSAVRMFIATKAGRRHLEIKDKRESLLDLMARIASKVQVNGSAGIMPQYLRDILEPRAASLKDRIEAMICCRERGIFAESFLCQPLIFPYLTRENVENYMKELAASGIRNIKPEFFSAEICNLVLVSQYINHFDPDKVGEFFYPYLREDNLQHIKNSTRLAPERNACVDQLKIICQIAKAHGISISICNWVKKELGRVADWVNKVDLGSTQNGYRCLGYQTHLFGKYGHENGF